MNPLVIIGSGLAGYGLLRELRKRDADMPVVLITRDAGEAYAKPSLSNALAAGKQADQLVSQTAAQVGESLKARVLVRTAVRAIERERQVVMTDQGEIAYGQLVLALGADPLAHGLHGEGADAVFSVNDLDDYRRFRTALAGRRRVLILGGGLIGCEFANDLAGAGHAVDVVLPGPAPLDRLLPEALGQTLAQRLAAQGVTWHFGRRAVAAERTDSGLILTLDDGARMATDVALAAIGLKPRTALATGAGLETARGICVDRFLRTNDAQVYAVGDCAEVEGRVLPYVMPLLAQVRALAATLTGAPTPVVYPAMPVVVKTPAWPLVVLPAPVGSAGAWRVEAGEGREGGQIATFHDAAGHLLGFALGGAATRERLRLTKALV